MGEDVDEDPFDAMLVEINVLAIGHQVAQQSVAAQARDAQGIGVEDTAKLDFVLKSGLTGTAGAMFPTRASTVPARLSRRPRASPK